MTVAVDPVVEAVGPVFSAEMELRGPYESFFRFHFSREVKNFFAPVHAGNELVAPVLALYITCTPCSKQ